MLFFPVAYVSYLDWINNVPQFVFTNCNAMLSIKTSTVFYAHNCLSAQGLWGRGMYGACEDGGSQ